MVRTIAASAAGSAIATDAAGAALAAIETIHSSGEARASGDAVTA
jgi:hypothetical protein